MSNPTKCPKKPARKPKRVVFRVTPAGRDGVRGYAWIATRRRSHGLRTQYQRATQREAWADATNEARLTWEHDGILTQAVLCGRNGRVIEERTYGADPVRTKG